MKNILSLIESSEVLIFMDTTVYSVETYVYLTRMGQNIISLYPSRTQRRLLRKWSATLPIVFIKGVFHGDVTSLDLLPELPL